mmetsp:Transcript_58791/g.135611  ORF Transcript_58791/g.135611 Transcript_58791/m.135611 type:complete len:740 (+) Transcript_58791:49-2268(+)
MRLHSAVASWAVSTTFSAPEAPKSPAAVAQSGAACTVGSSPGDAACPIVTGSWVDLDGVQVPTDGAAETEEHKWQLVGWDRRTRGAVAQPRRVYAPKTARGPSAPRVAWLDFHCEESSACASLHTTGDAAALMALPGGGLMAGVFAGGGGGGVDVFSRGAPTGSKPSWSGEARGAVSAVVLLGDDRIAVGTLSGSLEALYLPTAKESWRQAEIAEVQGGISSMLVVEDTLVLGTLSGWVRLYAADDLTKPPQSSLQASDAVASLLMTSGKILAAGTWGGAVDLYRTVAASPLRLGGPFAQLQGSGGAVACLLELPGGSVAAGSHGGFVDIFSSEAAQRGGYSFAQLQVAGEVLSMALLPEGGVAVGTLKGTIDLFPRSAVEVGGPSRGRLRTRQAVGALLLVRDGAGYAGLAAGTGGQRVELFTITAVDAATAPRPSVRVGDAVACMVALPGGGLAVGTEGGAIELFNGHDILRGGAPYAYLHAAAAVSSLLVLDTGELVTGSFQGTADVYSSASLSDLAGASNRHETLKVGDAVSTLAALPGGGLAVGTWGGVVELFRRGGTAPHAQLQVSNPNFPVALVNSLLILTSGQLAVGTGAGTVELFSEQALISGGSALGRMYASGSVHCLAPATPGFFAALTAEGLDLFHEAAGAGGKPLRSITIGSPATALAPVLHGGLAVAAGPRVHLFNASSLVGGGGRYAVLTAEAPITALTTLDSGAIAAGTEAGLVEVFAATVPR